MNINNSIFFNCWSFLLIILIVMLIRLRFNKNTKHIEGFAQQDKFVYYKDNNKIFDSLYSDIYDDLFYSKIRATIDIDIILPIVKFNAYSNILDAGCGTGYHIKKLVEKKYITTGIDLSKNMVIKARENNNNIEIKQGDITNAILYSPEEFTHILCLYFTIYYIEDKRQFLLNAYDWLQKDGILILHLVNREMFDPILPASNPLYMVSPQKYAKDRIVSSTIKFKDFDYSSKFHIDAEKNKGVFEETLKDDLTNNIRKQRHTLYMPTQKEILDLARQCGFTVIHKSDLVSAQYEYQYFYYLQKE
jgi:SAM-dependent methyltransferase